MASLALRQRKKVFRPKYGGKAPSCYNERTQARCATIQVPMPLRHTKIVATLGPASSSAEVLGRMIDAGLDVARLNFSHGSADEHRARAKLVRELILERERPVGLLGDLQGPKIRIGKFAQEKSRSSAGRNSCSTSTAP